LINPFSPVVVFCYNEWGGVGNYGEIVRCVGEEGEAFLDEGKHFGIPRIAERHNNSLLGKRRTAKCFLGNMNILLMQKDA